MQATQFNLAETSHGALTARLLGVHALACPRKDRLKPGHRAAAFLSRACLVIIVLLPTSKTIAQTSPPVDFVKDVQPILQKNCYSCHGTDKQKGDLRWDVKDLALKGGEHGAVRPVQAWTWVGAAQHGDFVAQHEELDVLGGGRAARQQDQPEDLAEDQIQQAERHAEIMSGQRSPPVSDPGPTSGTPHGPPTRAAVSG